MKDELDLIVFNLCMHEVVLQCLSSNNKCSLTSFVSPLNYSGCFLVNIAAFSGLPTNCMHCGIYRWIYTFKKKARFATTSFKKGRPLFSSVGLDYSGITMHIIIQL